MTHFNKRRGSHRRCSVKKGVLKNFANFTRKFHRKTPALESLFNKVAGLEAYNFIKKRLKHRCFPMNLPNF